MALNGSGNVVWVGINPTVDATGRFVIAAIRDSDLRGPPFELVAFVSGPGNNFSEKTIRNAFRAIFDFYPRTDIASLDIYVGVEGSENDALRVTAFINNHIDFMRNVCVFPRLPTHLVAEDVFPAPLPKGINQAFSFLKPMLHNTGYKIPVSFEEHLRNLRESVGALLVASATPHGMESPLHPLHMQFLAREIFHLLLNSSAF